MNGWGIAGLIFIGIVGFFMFIVPACRILWAWVAILEDKAEEAMARQKSRARRDRAS